MKTICYGELMIDMIADGRGPLSDRESFRRYAGGAAANVAAQIKKLGGDSAFLGKLGDDAFGRFLMDDMERHGIDTGGVLLDPIHRTTVAFVGLSEAGIPDYLFYRKGGASGTLRPEDLNRDYLRQAEIVYTSSLMLTAPQIRETTHWVLSFARRGGIKTAFDLNLRLSAWESAAAADAAIREVFPLTDLLKMNDDELRFLLGKQTDPSLGGRNLMKEYPGLNALIVTCGAEGAYLFPREGDPVFVPANPVEAADTTGAGDSYMGAFLYAYGACGCAMERLEAMGRWAGAAASFTVQSPGAIAAMPNRAAMETRCTHLGIECF